MCIFLVIFLLEFIYYLPLIKIYLFTQLIAFIVYQLRVEVTFVLSAGNKYIKVSVRYKSSSLLGNSYVRSIRIQQNKRKINEKNQNVLSTDYPYVLYVFREFYTNSWSWYDDGSG